MLSPDLRQSWPCSAHDGLLRHTILAELVVRRVGATVRCQPVPDLGCPGLSPSGVGRTGAAEIFFG